MWQLASGARPGAPNAYLEGMETEAVAVVASEAALVIAVGPSFHQ